MSEATGDPSVPNPAAATPAPPAPEAEAAEQKPEPREKREASIRNLLEAGAHFGHQTRRWNPQMKRFIFGQRNGIHIIDLDQSLPRLEEALEFVREVVAQGGRLLLVGTKRQAQVPIKLEADRSGQFYVNNRWLGGMLTNFRTVKKSIERFKEQLATVADEEKVADLSKKELSRLNRSIIKYQKSLDGIKEMSKLPAAMFIIDLNKEHIAVSEARRLGIPIIAVVDTNCSPEGIDFPIPGNDDALRAIQLYCELIADACQEGAEIFNERVTSQEAEAPAAAADAAPGGRRVVDIKPAAAPGRRSRQPGGTHSATPRRGRPEREAAPAPGSPAAESAEPASPSAEASPPAEPAAPAAPAEDSTPEPTPEG